jgi:hypothetical protein
MKGLPPRCRGKIWILAIGNTLNIPKGTYFLMQRLTLDSLSHFIYLEASETFYMYIKQQPKLPSDKASHDKLMETYHSPGSKRLSNSASSIQSSNMLMKSENYLQYSKSGGDLPSSNRQFEPFDPSKSSDPVGISIHRKGRTSSLEVLKSDDNQSESSRRVSLSSIVSDVESQSGRVKSFVMERQYVDDSKKANGQYDVLEREPSLSTEHGNGIGIRYSDRIHHDDHSNNTTRNSTNLSDIDLDDEEEHSEGSDEDEEVSPNAEREESQGGWTDKRMDIETEAYNYKVITEDILRTLPSLCVFQVSRDLM